MRYWRYILFAVILLGLAPVARSQAPVTYRVPVSGRARDAATGAPIAGARLTVAGSELVSTDDGTFPPTELSIATPVQEADVVVTAEGYLPWSFAGVILRAAQPIEFRVQLRRHAPGEPAPEPTAPPQPAPRPGGAGIQGISDPPEYIRIGLTGSSACVYDTEYLESIPVVHVHFVDYVRGVLPNEWIASWPAASLEAGAVATKQFGWYSAWIQRKWSRYGYPFDLLDSTCDQVYKPGTADVRTDAAIAATWRKILTRDGKLFPTYYRAHDEQCPATGNCMGQWGSKYKADAGMTYAEILLSYYTNAVVEEWGAAPEPTPTAEPSPTPCPTPGEPAPGPEITPVPAGSSRIYLPAVVHCSS